MAESGAVQANTKPAWLKKSPKRRKILLIIACVLCLLSFFHQDTATGEYSYLAVALPEEKALVLLDPQSCKIIRTATFSYPADCVEFSEDGIHMLVSDRDSNRVYKYLLPSFREQGYFTTLHHCKKIYRQNGDPDYYKMSHNEGQHSYSIREAMKHPNIPYHGKADTPQNLPVAKVHGSFGKNHDTDERYPINIVMDSRLQEVMAVRSDSAKPIASIPVGKEPESLGWSPDRSRCFVVVRGDSCIAVINPEALRVTKKVPVDPDPSHFVPTNNGYLAITMSSRSQSISVFDMYNEKFKHILRFATTPSDFSVWPGLTRSTEQPPPDNPSRS